MGPLEKKLRDGLQGAEAIGWSRKKIAAACRLNPGVVQKFLQHPDRGITVANADRIMRFLSMTCSDPIVPSLPADDAEARRLDLQKFGESLGAAMEAVWPPKAEKGVAPVDFSAMVEDEEAIRSLALFLIRNLDSEDQIFDSKRQITPESR